SPDGRLLWVIAASVQHRRGWQWDSIIVWDMARAIPIAVASNVEFEMQTAVRGPFRFNPDGKRVLFLTDRLRILDARTAEVLVGPLQVETRIIDAHFSPDGSQVLTVGLDNSVRVWDAMTGRP